MYRLCNVLIVAIQGIDTNQLINLLGEKKVNVVIVSCIIIRIIYYINQ